MAGIERTPDPPTDEARRLARWGKPLSERKGVGGTQQGPREFPDPPDEAPPFSPIAIGAPHEHHWVPAGVWVEDKGSMPGTPYVVFGCSCLETAYTRVF